MQRLGSLLDERAEELALYEQAKAHPLAAA
jgi:hypothetical protein